MPDPVNPVEPQLSAPPVDKSWDFGGLDPDSVPPVVMTPELQAIQEKLDALEAAKIDPDAPPPWKAAIDAQTASIDRLQGMVMQLATRPAAPAPGAQKDDDTLSPQDQIAVWKHAIQHQPELIPDLINQAGQSQIQREIAASEKRIAAMLQANDMTKQLGSAVAHNYGEVMNDPSNPLVQAANRMLPMVEQLIKPGTSPEMKNYMAMLMAAGQNPSEVVKTHSALEQVQEQRRIEQADRLSAIQARNRGAGTPATNTTLSATELELFETYNLDPNNKADRDAYLAIRGPGVDMVNIGTVG